MNATATRSYVSHATCSHDATPAARKACRARRALRTETTVIAHVGNVALVRLPNGTFTYAIAA